jgi:hypothetical protein
MSMTTGARPPAGAPLRPDFPALPAFGWLFLAAIGQVFVIPSPWTLTAAYSFLCRNVRLPDNRRLSFAGQPGDIWYVIVGLALLAFVPHVGAHATGMRPANAGLLQLVVFLINSWLFFLVTQWFVASVKSEDGRLSIRFAGSLAGYVGWHLLLLVSMITIIGWAWVAKFFLRWICRNVTGNVAFDFVGSGFSILWRSVVFALVCSLIIPIPWMLRWLMNWYASQVIAVPVA